jgi:hypothetical protein
MAMWLVLCAAHDVPALWAARGLQRRGLRPLEIITAEALAYSRRFVHRIVGCKPSVNIVLADGREIDSATVCGALNRLQRIPSEHLRSANTSDRQYAEQELYALFLSWVYGLPAQVVNRPAPQGLSGTWRHASEWIWLANQAGLSTLLYCQSDTRETQVPCAASRAPTVTIIVLNGACFGATAPPSVTAGCRRLAELSETTLLGVEFQITSMHDWVFIAATPCPDLRLGGEALLDGLADALRS